MFNGKNKAFTLSYDDGITQDQRFINIINKYGLKCTFNLNSGKFGQGGSLVREDVTVAHVKPRKEEIARIYEGHEIAAHTLNHPWLKSLSDEEIIYEIEEDRKALSEIAGYEVVGMAYPCGTDAVDKRVEKLVKNNTGIKYARTTSDTLNFDLQDNLIMFNPTVYHLNFDKLFELGKRFIELKTDKPQIFYVWGHTYEFDIANTWDRFEEFCRLISNKDDIFYGTNKEILLSDD